MEQGREEGEGEVRGDLEKRLQGRGKGVRRAGEGRGPGCFGRGDEER